MNELAKIDMHVGPGHARLMVNGQDITQHVQAVYLDARGHEMPRVGVEFTQPDFHFDGDGVVEIIRDAPDIDPVAAVVDFLRSVDTQALETRVLETADMSVTTGDAFIAALLELVRGRA